MFSLLWKWDLWKEIISASAWGIWHDNNQLATVTKLAWGQNLLIFAANDRACGPLMMMLSWWVNWPRTALLKTSHDIMHHIFLIAKISWVSMDYLLLIPEGFLIHLSMSINMDDKESQLLVIGRFLLDLSEILGGRKQQEKKSTLWFLFIF